jgi:DNA modification methylase
MRWLVWDKGQRNFSLADVELAWTSQDKAARALTYPRGAALLDGKEHPTQKPIEVMCWCLGFLPDARTILDPFMGSGTTGVACVQLGRGFIGIELDPGYFDIACRRISDELKRPRLALPEPPPAPVQQAMEI